MQGPLVFVGIFGLFFILWLAGGGPDRPLSFAGPYLNPITGPGQTATPYGDPSQYGSVNSTIGLGPGGVSISGGAGGASSYSTSVRFSRDLTGVSATDPKAEYVVLSLSSGAGKAVSTAGWKLIGEEGSAGFPQGAEVPRSGRVNELAPITLRPGDTAIVVTGRSPIGLSFRENLCTGYLEENQDFRPALTLECPSAWQEYERYYDDDEEACRRFVQTAPYCSSETDVPSGVSSSCERFTEEYLNYNGCVAAHGKDSDFASRTWRIFLGRSDELYPRSNGTIRLVDAEGKTIDSLEY